MPASPATGWNVKVALPFVPVVAPVVQDALAGKTSGVKALTVDGVEASAATVNSGKYAYARLVRFYTNKAKESQATKDFTGFVGSARGQEIIQQIGFAPKP